MKRTETLYFLKALDKLLEFTKPYKSGNIRTAQLNQLMEKFYVKRETEEIHRIREEETGI